MKTFSTGYKPIIYDFSFPKPSKPTLDTLSNDAHLSIRYTLRLNTYAPGPLFLE